MLVKLQDKEDEKMERDLAYRVRKGKRNYYYSSKEAYEAIESDIKYRHKSMNLLTEILGFKNAKDLPQLTYKYINEYQEPLGLDVLYDTLIFKRNDIEYALGNKDFESELAKIKYIFGIVQNNYMTEYKKKVAMKRLQSVTPYSAIDVSGDITTERRQAVKDIRAFLDDDED